MDVSKMQTDSTLEEKGNWIPLDAETSVLIASPHTAKYKALGAAKFKPYRALIQANGGNIDSVPDKEQERIVIECMAEGIILDWKGMKWEGEPIDYSIANAKKLLAVRAFRDMIAKLAGDVANFQHVGREEDTKNSEPASAGN